MAISDMSHKRKSYEFQFKSIVPAIEALRGSPLKEVAEHLEGVIKILTGSSTTDLEVLGPVHSLADYMSWLLGNLPKTFNQRFAFDAALLNAIALEWNPKLRLDRVLIPVYEHNWGYRKVPLPSLQRDSTYVMHLFLMPGTDDLEDINLLDYPWILHELAHYVLRTFPDVFPKKFAPRLEAYLANLRFKAIADRDAAGTRARRALENLEQRWSPTLDQRNWAHEIATDIFALASCGPAYIHSFASMLQDRQPHPFNVDTEHPPYFVRIAALLMATDSLGFKEYASRLRDLQRTYFSDARKSGEINLLLRVGPEELIRDCVDSAIGSLQELELAGANLSCLRVPFSQGEHNFGMHLILRAWHSFRSDAKGYDQWERQTVMRLTQTLTL